MKRVHHSWIKWVCTGILLAAPLAPVSVAQASSPKAMEKEALEQIKQLPPKAKRIVEETAEFFFRSQHKLDVQIQKKGEDAWDVQLSQHPEEIGQKHQPGSVALRLSKGGKLERLDAFWDAKENKGSISQWTAVNEAEGFVNQVLGSDLRAGLQPSRIGIDWFAIPLYPVVNNITVQKEAASVIVDAAGNLRSFQTKEIELREAMLPSRSGVIDSKDAKRAFADLLSVELVYDDERGKFGYQSSPFSRIDAKTGQKLTVPYETVDEEWTLDQDKKPAPMSIDKAKAIASSYAGLDAGKLNVRTSRQKHPDEDAKTIFTVTDGNRILILKTDENTGTLLTIHEEDAEKTTASNGKNADEAKQKARHFIESYASLEKGDYVLREKRYADGEAASDYQFELYPMHGDIRAAKPILTLSFDRGQNTLSAMTTRSFQRYSAATPAVINVDQAKRAWLDAISLELQYVYLNASTMKDEQAKLAYVPSFSAESRFLNAATGQLEKAAD